MQPDSSVAMSRSSRFRLPCDSCQSGFGATPRLQQGGAILLPITCLTRVSSPNKRNMVILELEADAVPWATRRLMPYCFRLPFVIVSRYQARVSMVKVGERDPLVQRWMELFGASITLRWSVRGVRDEGMPIPRCLFCR